MLATAGAVAGLVLIALWSTALVLITLPILVITMFMQRFIVSGLTAGATKG